ncbi:MAG: aminopeptidase P family N-terminal domain-containing protein, partial [Muribaculaceae bacterium]|nr:aminopeptidase P family N-terminal domain-containing protein [Muribaculaceae bacterium]
MKNNVPGNLAALREAMKNRGVSAAIIPQADPHMSEYISNHWQARRMLSGFSGSAGDLVVTLDKALLWTDSRYFLQAGQQLEGTEIALMKDGLPGTPSIADWLKDNLRGGEKVGIDGLVFSTLAKESLAMELESAGLVLVSDFDVLDEIWKDRPALPDGAVFVHPEEYCGKSARTKIEEILKGVKKEGAEGIFISALDEIAWTLNIRSNDVKYNPVATAFLYLSNNGCTLLIDSNKVSDEVKLYLDAQGVKTAEYSDVKKFLAGLPENERVVVDPARNAAAIVDILGSRAVKAASPVALLKACKNEAQLAGTREAMIRDGVAMVKSLHEIKSKVAAGEKLTEMDVAEILRKYRSAGKFYYEESFGTIAGYGPHGAIVHYEADEESNSELKAEGLLLIDSGAQYLDGTTDITRTISLGAEPTADEKRDFT